MENQNLKDTDTMSGDDDIEIIEDAEVIEDSDVDESKDKKGATKRIRQSFDEYMHELRMGTQVKSEPDK